MRNFTVLLLFTFILLSGCTSYDESDEKTVKGDITGTSGMSLKFSYVPDKIIPGQTFSIPVEIENRGKANIENGILTISGYNEQYVSFSYSKIENINLEGINKFTNQGEKAIKTFIAYKTTPPESEYVANFVVTACYPYKTEAAPTVCVNPKIFTQSVVGKDECKEIDYTLSSQGAPVAVTKIETWFDPQNSYWYFKIDAENKGGGRIRAIDAYAKDCIGPALSPDDLGKVKIEAYLGGKQINCFESVDLRSTVPTRNTDSFKIDAGKGSVVCGTAIDRTDSAYRTPLNLILSYGYVNSISKQVQMVKNIARI